VWYEAGLYTQQFPNHRCKVHQQIVKNGAIEEAMKLLFSVITRTVWLIIYSQLALLSWGKHKQNLTLLKHLKWRILFISNWLHRNTPVLGYAAKHHPETKKDRIVCCFISSWEMKAKVWRIEWYTSIKRSRKGRGKLYTCVKYIPIIWDCTQMNVSKSTITAKCAS
jgi:hypothetical protein